MRVHNRFNQWGGAAFILGNILFLVNKLNEMSHLFLARPMPDVISGQDILLIFVGQVSLIIGYVAYFRCYAARVSKFGKQALRLFCGGGSLVAIGHGSFMQINTPRIDFLFIAVIIGMTLMLIGLIWFGITNLRQPVLGHGQWLPLATGLLGFVGFFFFSGEAITAIFLLLRTLFAIGLIGLGLTLWLEKPGGSAVAPMQKN